MQIDQCLFVNQRHNAIATKTQSQNCINIHNQQQHQQNRHRMQIHADLHINRLVKTRSNRFYGSMSISTHRLSTIYTKYMHCKQNAIFDNRQIIARSRILCWVHIYDHILNIHAHWSSTRLLLWMEITSNFTKIAHKKTNKHRRGHKERSSNSGDSRVHPCKSHNDDHRTLFGIRPSIDRTNIYLRICIWDTREKLTKKCCASNV